MSFCQKIQNCRVRTDDFVQISPVCRHLSNNVRRDFKFPMAISVIVTKILIRKINLTVILPLKLSPAIVAFADIGSLKSLHVFLKLLLIRFLKKKSYGPNKTKSKKSKLNPIFKKMKKTKQNKKNCLSLK